VAFDNVKGILNIGSPLSSYKLLLMQGALSRPKYGSLFRSLLRPFVSNGRITVRYRCHDRSLKSFVRASELESDFYSIRELGVNDVYSLDLAFHPDLVIDGGGNIGMFTLRASAGLQSAGDTSVRYVICEPVPGNVEQIRTHLAVNGLEAEIKPVCLGGTPGIIPFYIREANQSSFESDKPYRSVIEIPVITLADAIGPNPAERILIKLDIEGMEIEVLNAFLPSEQRAVYLVGELHSFSRNAPLMEEMFRAHGWTLELLGIADDLCSFRGCSPAALPLLPSLAAVARSGTPSPQS
jgi:FkbM family methyltransferase